MTLPAWDGDYPHTGHDGRRLVGWPCPTCGCEDADAVYLEPPYGAVARCRGRVTDPDWGRVRPCGAEFLVAF